MFEKKWGEVMERRTQRRVVRKSRKIRKNTFLLLTMALILCLGTLAMGGQKGIQTKTYYECVQVEKGDTLWEIAEEYRMDGEKTEHMVEAILEVNGLKDANVQAGESIIVPDKSGIKRREKTERMVLSFFCKNRRQGGNS